MMPLAVRCAHRDAGVLQLGQPMALNWFVAFARRSMMTRTGTPALNLLISSVVYRASSMNQKPTSMPTSRC